MGVHEVMETYGIEWNPVSIESSVIPLVATVQPQLYWSNVPILRKQLAYIDGIARHPKPCAQDHPWPLLEPASFRHLKEMIVDSLPFRPMRTWHGDEINGKV